MTRAFGFGLLVGLLGLSAASAGCDGPPTQPTPLAVTLVSPSAGAATGGLAVTISGHGFKNGATVQFGGVSAVASVVSPATITATTPAHAEGPVSVVVTNPGGQFARRDSAYTYGAGPPNGGQSRTLRGFVGDTIHRPLGGARIEVLDGPQTGSVATTDDSGWFTLTAVLEDTTRLRVTREGHVTATGTMAFFRRDGPTDYVSILLAVLVVSVSIEGDYSLTFVADDRCTTVPENLRTRTYSTTIAPDTSSTNPAGTFLWANITGVSYFANQSRIPILVAGNDVTFWLGEHGYGAAFVEQVAPNTYLQFDGSATVSAGESPVSFLSTTFEGATDYCVTKSPMTGLYYDCNSSAVTNVHCVSKNHRLILKRR